MTWPPDRERPHSQCKAGEGYNLAERPTASFFADTFGGAKEEWDVLKDFAELHDGTATAWNAMMAITNDTPYIPANLHPLITLTHQPSHKHILL